MYLSACWKTGQNPCKNTHGENCIAQVGCWYFVRLCGAAGVGCEVSDEKKSKPIHILTALFATGIHKEYKQVLPYRPTSWKPWPTSSTVCVSFSMLENRTEPMQEQTWWKLHCASCLLVFCAVVWCCWCWLRSEWGKKTIQTYPYSNCTFHHQSSQRKQTNFKVPANLGKTLANIICCMCLFQHVGKQDRTHARTSMVKIALRKLFAGILCGCVVLLVGCEVSDGKKPSKPIHIITALFTDRIHKENKQILPYQPTLLKTLANTIYCMCLFQHVGKRDRTHARTNMVKIALRKLFAGILCGCVVLLVLVMKWVMKKNNPNTSIFELHFSPPEFTKKTNKFYRTNQPYWKLWPT